MLRCHPFSCFILAFCLALTHLTLLNAQGTAIDDGTPRIAHPPNQIHMDKRYGIAVGPSQELFTGDVIVITVEDDNPYDGSPIFNVWSVNDAGQLTCIDPLATTSAAYGAQQQKTSNAYSAKGFEEPTYGYSDGETSVAWSPSLAHMFVVNVVDGRLGQFQLSPVVTFPQSPKYITPQPNRQRSGVASSVGSDGWAIGEDEVLAINSFTPPGDSLYAYSIGFYFNAATNQYQYRDELSKPYGNTNPNGHYMSTSAQTEAREGGRTRHSRVFSQSHTPRNPKERTGTSDDDNGPSLVSDRFKARGYAMSKKQQAFENTEMPMNSSVNGNRSNQGSGRSACFRTRAMRSEIKSKTSTNNNGRRASAHNQCMKPSLPLSAQRSAKTFKYGYTADTQHTSSVHADAEGYEDGGRLAIRGSSMHSFCRCDYGFVLCYNVGQPTLMYPDPSNLAPVFSWFKINKIPSQVVRQLMENYMNVVSGGLPRTFLLFASMPFTDNVDSLHFHGAEAMLSSRRVRLGQIRMTTRGTQLEQQTTLVLRNLVSDTVLFTFAIGLFEVAVFSIGQFPLIPVLTPFSHSKAKHVMMLQKPTKSASATEGEDTRGTSEREHDVGNHGDAEGDAVTRHDGGDGGEDVRSRKTESYNWLVDRKTHEQALADFKKSQSVENDNVRPKTPGILQDYTPHEELHLKTHTQAGFGVKKGRKIPMITPSIGQVPRAMAMHGYEDESHDEPLRAYRHRNAIMKVAGPGKRRGIPRMRTNSSSGKTDEVRDRSEHRSGGSVPLQSGNAGAETEKVRPIPPKLKAISRQIQEQKGYNELVLSHDTGAIGRPEEDKLVDPGLVKLMGFLIRGIVHAYDHELTCEISTRAGQENGRVPEEDRTDRRQRAFDADAFPGVCVDAWVVERLGLEKTLDVHEVTLENEHGKASITYPQVREVWQARLAVLKSRSTHVDAGESRADLSEVLVPHDRESYTLTGRLRKLLRAALRRVGVSAETAPTQHEAASLSSADYKVLSTYLSSIDAADKTVLLAGVLASHYNSAWHATAAKDVDKLISSMRAAQVASIEDESTTDVGVAGRTTELPRRDAGVARNVRGKGDDAAIIQPPHTLDNEDGSADVISQPLPSSESVSVAPEMLSNSVTQTVHHRDLSEEHYTGTMQPLLLKPFGRQTRASLKPWSINSVDVQTGVDSDSSSSLSDTASGPSNIGTSGQEQDDDLFDGGSSLGPGLNGQVSAANAAMEHVKSWHIEARRKLIPGAVPGSTETAGIDAGDRKEDREEVYTGEEHVCGDEVNCDSSFLSLKKLTNNVWEIDLSNAGSSRHDENKQEGYELLPQTSDEQRERPYTGFERAAGNFTPFAFGTLDSHSATPREEMPFSSSKRASARPTPVPGSLGYTAEDKDLLDALPSTRRAKTTQVNVTVLDSIFVSEELTLDFTFSWSQGSVIEFAGEYAMIVPANTAYTGHVVQHIGFSTMPFTLDLVRQEYYWPAQWVADGHLPADAREIATTAGFSAFQAARSATVMGHKGRAKLRAGEGQCERGKRDVFAVHDDTHPEPVSSTPPTSRKSENVTSCDSLPDIPTVLSHEAGASTLLWSDRENNRTHAQPHGHPLRSEARSSYSAANLGDTRPYVSKMEAHLPTGRLTIQLLQRSPRRHNGGSGTGFGAVESVVMPETASAKRAQMMPNVTSAKSHATATQVGALQLDAGMRERHVERELVSERERRVQERLQRQSRQRTLGHGLSSTADSSSASDMDSYHFFSQYQYRSSSSTEHANSDTLDGTRVSYSPLQSSTSSPRPSLATCLNPFASNIFADFTIRRASVEQDLYSLVNPLGLVHPAQELHHFAISGVYSATNTFFVEFIVERVG